MEHQNNVNKDKSRILYIVHLKGTIYFLQVWSTVILGLGFECSSSIKSTSYLTVPYLKSYFLSLEDIEDDNGENSAMDLDDTMQIKYKHFLRFSRLWKTLEAVMVWAGKVKACVFCTID